MRMYVLITIFASSLFLVALFFAVKEREIYSGTAIWLTRLLRRYSPAAQTLAVRMGQKSLMQFRSLLVQLGRFYEKMLRAVTRGSRTFVVLVAERMIHAVRGEKMLSMRSTSSMYLKHLKEHKDNISNDVPQV